MVGGCSPSTPGTQSPTETTLTPGGCRVAASVTNPYVVEWSSADKGLLETRLGGGLVAVAYDGCEMSVKSRCKITGAAYDYVAFNSRKRDSLRLESVEELYAKLPLGVVRLEGEFERFDALRVEMSLVGRYESSAVDVRPDQLEGDCEGVTHAVWAVTVGAHEVQAEERRKAAAAAQAGSAGAGAARERARESISRDGDAAACDGASPGDTAPPANCGAVIRLEVVAIGAAKPRPAVCEAGSEWDGEQCVRTVVVTKTKCPAGSKRVGDQCVSMQVAATKPPAPQYVRIAGGTFDGHTIAAFDMKRTEVTVDEFARCVAAGRCKSQTALMGANWGFEGRGEYPMNGVSASQAHRYCEFDGGGRLPTQWEWEWAARGRDEARTYPWGSAAPSCALAVIDDGADGCGEDRTWPVGSKPKGATRDGLQDMAGNVWEWTSTRTNGGDDRVVRGGGWFNRREHYLQTSYRNEHEQATGTHPKVGFRCVRPVSR